MTYVTEIYCQKAGCNVRQCEIVTKDHGDNPEPVIWHCPACGSAAKVHWRHSLGDHERQELGRSIGKVNAALYLRDQRGGAVPGDVYKLNSLPDSWKCERATEEKT
jgi:hypothetical protein